MAAESDGGRGNIRAADADRDHVAESLGTAYTEGRLARDEYDARLDAAYAARTYGELDKLVADLPRQSPMPAVRGDTGPAAGADGVPVSKTNGLAMASLACGLGQFLVGPLATIPAIVLGHAAMHQIKRTGEQGAVLAFAGLVLGWGAVILGLIAVIGISMVATAGMNGAVQVP